MKLMSYELSDWNDIPTSSKNYCNYYRQYRSDWMQFSIGLIIRTNNCPLRDRRWRFETCGLRDERLIELFDEKFKDTEWCTYDQLDHMKQKIDNFIMRINNLAVFT